MLGDFGGQCFDRDARRRFSRLRAAHAVRDREEALLGVHNKTIFVVGPNQSDIRHAVAINHGFDRGRRPELGAAPE